MFMPIAHIYMKCYCFFFFIYSLISIEMIRRSNENWNFYQCLVKENQKQIPTVIVPI